jgi:Ca2+/Na+ antiporter
MFIMFVQLLLLMAAMSMTFFAVCNVCDEYLVPSIQIFIEQFNIPEDVAGVTFIAFGSAAPELLLNILSGAEGTSDLSLSALLGSSLIAFGLIPPLCLIMTPNQEMKLNTWPVAREIIFYVLGLCVFLVLMQDGELTIREAGSSVIIYVIYVVLVVITFIWFPEKANIDGSNVGLLKDIEMNEVSAGGKSNSSPKLHTVTTSSHGTEIKRTSSSSSTKLNVNNDNNLQAHTHTPISNDNNRDKDANDAMFTSVSPQSSSDVIITGNGTVGSSLVLVEGEDVENVVKIPVGFHHSSLLYIQTCLFAIKNKVFPTLHTIWTSFTSPIAFVISMTIPDIGVKPGNSGAVEKDVDVKVKGSEINQKKISFLRAFSVFSMSILWVAILAWCIIGLSEMLIKFIGVGASTVGATFVALGSEIPDAVASIALARNGYHDGAIAGAIGSQVINITLGVGLPILVSVWYNGESIKINHAETRSLWLLTGLLMIVISGYAGVSLPLRNIYERKSCKLQKFTSMKRKAAWALLLLLGVVIVVFITLNEGDMMNDIVDDDKINAPEIKTKTKRRFF